MDLPRYSNKETLKERLLIAIRLCGEIDDDASYMDAEEDVDSINNDLD